MNRLSRKAIIIIAVVSALTVTAAIGVGSFLPIPPGTYVKNGDSSVYRLRRRPNRKHTQLYNRYLRRRKGRRTSGYGLYSQYRNRFKNVCKRRERNYGSLYGRGMIIN